jgi:pimeloyl-ACP methyl ester carboxylesterase
LLIHGFPFDHSMWRGQMDSLSDQYRVIAPDLRGFGHSGVTPGTVTMREMVHDLTALLDALDIDEPVTVGGLSMGGYVAFQFVRDEPQRVRALMLCDTRAEADTPDVAATRRQTADRLLREGVAFLAEGMPSKLLSPATLREKPELVSEVREMMLGHQAKGLAAASRGMSQRSDATPWLADIRCPVLVVGGRDDTISRPVEMAAMARAIPGAKYVEIPAAGHLSPLEQPETVTQAMREFLEQLP